MSESFLQLKSARASKAPGGYSVSMQYEYEMEDGDEGVAFVDRFIADLCIEIKNEVIFIDADMLEEIEISIAGWKGYRTVGIEIVEPIEEDV